MSVRIFLSSVSDEFRDYRDQLRHDLTRHNVEVKVQEDFRDLGSDTLDKLDTYIRHCDAVVHLIGDMTGSVPGTADQDALLAKYPDMASTLPPLGEALTAGAYVSYTQWEAWLALYHGKLLLTAEAEDTAPRGPNYVATDDSRRTQASHLGRLRAARRYPGSRFASPADLAKHIAYTAILDLLVKDYAESEARAREVAEGFIREMAGRVSRDRGLDLDGMKEAVRNAIELYGEEIAGRPAQTNVGAVVDRALARAREQVDSGRSGLAKATLRHAAEEMRQDEAERRERYEQGVRILYAQERDIALAGYDAAGAAAATLEMAAALHQSLDDRLDFLDAEVAVLHKFGSDRGSNIHLAAEIELLRAIIADRARERVPLDWAMTQNNLGIALQTLGEREGGPTRLAEAAAAYRLALEERTRERVPLDWAATQNNLGNALKMLGGRESGTARLEEAVAAFRLALEERTRERVPLDWAATQNNLGNALQTLGRRESGTARLEEAVAAYRLALEELSRERVPLDWAMTQNNLGIALRTLGERESGTARLEGAAAAYRLALEERTRERVPLDWAATQNNLGIALRTLGERESGTPRLEEAVAAFRLALEERSRERVPLDWATTQNNLGNALATLGERVMSRRVLVDARSAITNSWDVYREAGYQQHDAYFANLIATVDAALANLD